MKSFLLKMLLISIPAAFLTNFTRFGHQLWSETRIAETVGMAIGLLFFSAIGGLICFYIFIFWKYKRFDEKAFQKISWSLWVVAFVANLFSAYKGT